ncbi:type 2 lanthipeptide synthetase LanM family protein [Bacillus cereus]|uniref:type 2 lanthipeptide synthetase LanM family protein n=1 Tax=Bacillus cereus TaxID=1396 RepID=UPI00356D6DF9
MSKLLLSKELSPWNRGLYLHERSVKCQEINQEMNEEINHYIKEWYKRTGIPQRFVAKRLANDGLDENSFRKIISTKEIPNALKEERWMELLEEIFSKEHIRVDDNDLDSSELNSHMFLDFIRPFLEWTKTEISKSFEQIEDNYTSKINEMAIQRNILTAVCRNLITLAGRVLIYELNLARLEKRLHGETPEKRFEYFVEKFITRKEDIYKILSKYPVLARLMVQTAERWENAIFEALERFLHDYDFIQESFSGDFSKLVNIKTGVGDLHKNGRSVFVFEFSSADQLVYKPRSMSIDVHFNQLLNWLNNKGANPQFKLLRVLNHGEYGWQEFVEAKECNTLEGVKDFYQRLGGYIAVLHILHATDMHMENIIASGEHPQFIDLESLFQNFNPVSDDEFTALQKATDELSQSVLRTALLPASLFKSGSFRSIELSGIGGHGGQRLPRAKYEFENSRTDKMRLVKGIGFSKGAKNRPMYAGKEAFPEKYLDNMVSGFESVYNLFLNNQQELLSSEGPILPFENDKVRALMRHTQSYSTMLEGGIHPESLQDGLNRVLLFDYLWRVAEVNEDIVPLISSETHDLLLGDVPYFQSCINSTSVWDSRGKEVKEFYKQSALENTLNRIRMLTVEDCQKQMKYIRISMTTMLKRWDLKEYRNDFSNRKLHSMATSEQFLQQAITIGDKLLESAFWGNNLEDVNWIGIGASLNDRWLFTPLDASLYDGVLGVAMFYAYLGEISNNEKYTQVAKSAVQSALDFLKRYDGLGSLSAFNGYASVAYVFSHLAVLWDDNTYLQKALIALSDCEKWIEKDQAYDLIGGATGTLIVALRLYELTKSKKAIEIAIKCGEHLIKNAKQQREGYGWTSHLDADTALVGLSHGTAGMAWALAELYTVTNDEQFLNYSKQAIAYERTMFMPDEGNWSDLRYREERKRLGIVNPVQWCHGAAGIALGRLMTLPHWNDTKMEEEIRIAIETTLRDGFGGSHCQCHGDFGNLEVLLVASDILDKPDLYKNAVKIGTEIVHEVNETGWCCGIPQNEDTPSLMLGLSGIGYGLLRLAAPQKVPPVLVLGKPMGTIK